MLYPQPLPMTPIDLRSNLTVIHPTGNITLIPAPRNKVQELRQLLIKLQSYWLEKLFSTGETIAEAQCWQLMQLIAALLPRQDNPAVTGFDLEALANDYSQLEALFFAENKDIAVEQLHDGQTVGSFNFGGFSGCRILRLHLINPVQVLVAADELRKSRLAEAA